MIVSIKFLIPNKKTAFVFAVLTVTMGIALLHGETFSEREPSLLYKMLGWITEPVWEVWLYVSAPILYFFGLMPQSNIRWHYFESLELVYGLNFAYYYLIASFMSYLWNWAERFGMRVKK